MNRPSLSPFRRYLAVDVGSRCIKVLLISNLFGRIRVHAHRLIGLDETSQPGAPGWKRVVQEIQEELGSHPMAVSIPQHTAISQVTDLPGANARSIRSQIEKDVLSLSGLTESNIVFDYGQLVPFGQYSNPYWVTHAREEEVLSSVQYFQELNGQVWEITSSGNALAAAYREAQPKATNAMLVDLGSGGTEVVIVYEGQSVYMTSFAVGGLFFLDVIRKERGCSVMEGEFVKNTEDLLSGDGALPDLQQMVDRWHGEMVRILEDWLSEHPLLNVTANSFEVVLCGGEPQMPGLVDYLRGHSVLTFKMWEDLPMIMPVQPEGQFAVAFGLACKLMRRPGPSASLVPEEMRAVRKEQSALQLLHAGTWVVLIIIAIVLGFGTWQKSYVLRNIETQLDQARAVIQKAHQTDRLKLQLAGDYEAIRPVLARQRETVAAVQTLGLLSSQPLPTNEWFVLFADSYSYYHQQENLVISANGPVRSGPALFPLPLESADQVTNSFIAEISTSMYPLEANQALSELIDQLKRNSLFRKVDILSPDQRRRLAHDAVLVPGGHYAISIALNENEFQSPFLTAKEIEALLPVAETNDNRTVNPRSVSRRNDGL